ncbi:hypothetical protein [Moritella sp. F3]|uniref:hypothetical protein n=1 Tax=Moritella sp. F3 TaxID=2718882 RepID=UPI0018E106B1|nr:hypothetical protein [Moritella sp. F3]GIC77114.1 hypothetical protein FMO001_18410 [Moritella sp. F1]GIC82233.1 hypothetical protein FMO003_25140 [Moritella sp. F3]
MPAQDPSGVPLGIQFVQSRFMSESLKLIANKCIETAKTNAGSKHAQNMSSGFLTNFLRQIVQENSDNQILFDTVHQIANVELQEIDLAGLILDMAELGHIESLKSKQLVAPTDKESMYWGSRTNYLVQH